MNDELDALVSMKQERLVLYNRIDKLRAALAEAIEGMEDMIGYVDDYFQEKWDHQGYLSRAKEALKDE